MVLKYAQADLESRYEIWNGVKVVKEPSSPYHETTVGNILFTIQSFIRKHNLGQVFLSNTGVHLDPESRDFVMPDLSYVSSERMAIVKQNGILGAPDLVVEVVSPGVRNTKRDTVDKFEQYQKHGVKEYWLIDYMEQEVFMYGLSDKGYEPLNESVVLRGIELSKDEVFRGLEETY